MTDACDETFKIVDEIRKTESRTKGVDAFSLAWIRAERQIRRLLTSLVFQAKVFDESHTPALVKTLQDKKRPYLYFSHFRDSIFALAAIPIGDLVGKDYVRLNERMNEAWKYRQKIFHGLLTGDRLTTGELLSLEDDIRAWCKNLSNGARSNELRWVRWKVFQKTSRRFGLQDRGSNYQVGGGL